METNIETGSRLAKILAGSWLDSSSVCISVDGIANITPLLLKSGGGAIGWWRVKHSSLRSTPAAHELHQAYRLHTLQAAIKELEIGQVFSFLRSQGLEPLMGKGWAIARHYPERGLRPYGDIDLYVRPEQYNAFVTALKKPEARKWDVDLHCGVAELDDRSFDELFAHSQLIRVGEVEVRIFGPEDHFRLLCLHLLREGALRPLWLCDIAVALESRPANFDWDYFLSGNKRRTDWAACAIGLAHQLLGAKVDDTPVAWRAKHLPHWLVPTVLYHWGKGTTIHGQRQPMATYLRHRAGVINIIKALCLRWPNPIEATIGVKGPFNEWPRWPFQLGDSLSRTARFLTRLPKLLHSQR